MVLAIPGNKVGYIFPIVVVSILPNVVFGVNDHRKDAPHFNMKIFQFDFIDLLSYKYLVHINISYLVPGIT